MIIIFFIFIHSLSLQNLKRTLDNDDKELQQISKAYSEVLHTHPTADPNGEIRLRIKDLNHRWETLNGTVNESMKNV